jgi:hypothetical protein
MMILLLLPYAPAMCAMLDGRFDAAVVNAVITFLRCGLGACPDNPAAYLGLR